MSGTHDRQADRDGSGTTGVEVRAADRDDAPDVLDRVDAPADARWADLDARELPPPEPLRRTLELLAELDDDVVLVQYNDRAPQHLYPKLADRGYDHETVETDDCVVTAIWSEG